MYKKHLFVCTTGKTCPGRGSQDIRDALKKRMKEEGLSGEMRINNCGCLGQCELGPNMALFPEGTWYSGVTLSDVPEIFESLKTGQRIDRLLNPNHHPPAEDGDRD